MENTNIIDSTCRSEIDITTKTRERLSEVTEAIIADCRNPECYTHIDYEPIPSVKSVVEIINRLKVIIFPGYFDHEKLDPANLKYSMGQSVYLVFDMLAEQISNGVRHDCFKYKKKCSNCEEQGRENAIQFLQRIPEIRRILATDVKATFDGDPAAGSFDEIIFCYPGIQAITIFRIAHELYLLKVPILPRLMTEYAHSITGIDIHPGATIGERFVIDHGTGVVIGETTLIGENVRVYQGVTLGAHSLPKDAGVEMKGKKRHPTIEDHVIIYSGATILGGLTTIGKRSVIGGNVWITKSIQPDTKAIQETPGLILIST